MGGGGFCSVVLLRALVGLVAVVLLGLLLVAVVLRAG